MEEIDPWGGTSTSTARAAAHAVFLRKLYPNKSCKDIEKVMIILFAF